MFEWLSTCGLSRALRQTEYLPKNLAILIDGDGVSPSDASKVIEHVAQLGRLRILRTYGNFTGRSATAWTSVVRKHGMTARHMPSMAPGKNATDIALTVDAVEILLTRRIEAFVLVTSDSDFSPLAHRIREEGKNVYAFGSRSTPDSFRRACTTFHEIRSLSITPLAALWSREPSESEALILPALVELSWHIQPVAIQYLGEYLARRHPDFDSRIYCRRTLTELLRDLPSVELVERDGRHFARPAAARN